MSTRTQNQIQDTLADYMPLGYEAQPTGKAYWKMKDLKQGENRLRVMIRPIAGWLEWVNDKPRRYPVDEKPAKSHNPDKPLQFFWTLYVWDYAREGLYIMEITQSSLLKAFKSYGSDEDWGDFRDYDIKICKEGVGQDSRYSSMPCPKKPITEAMRRALAASPVRLEALYEGGDPWNDLEGVTRSTATPKPDSNTISVEEAIKVIKSKVFLPPEGNDHLLTSYLRSHEKEMKSQLTKGVVRDFCNEPDQFIDRYQVWIKRWKISSQEVVKNA